MYIQDVKDMKHAGLMLEFVATRDIQEGEEIFLDYGRDWEDAWKKHVLQWEEERLDDKSKSDSRNNKRKLHTYASLFDEQTGVVKTHQEQQLSPYPENLFTSCYYNYSYRQHKNRNAKKIHKWEMTNSTFLHSSLRPCIILDRHESFDGYGYGYDHDDYGDNRDDNESFYFYTVAIQNRYGLSEDKRIPRGEKHIVNRVPRWAIKFSGKLYTSDQHYANAFRHEIGLPNDIFPENWMDKEARENLANF